MYIVRKWIPIRGNNSRVFAFVDRHKSYPSHTSSPIKQDLNELSKEETRLKDEIGHGEIGRFVLCATK